MAEEQNEIRSINWSELFTFTQIFKGWKMAIHPSKLMLAMAAVVLLFLLGWAMDMVWGWADRNVLPGEIALHAQASTADFDLAVAREKEARLPAAATLKASAVRNLYGLADYAAACDQAAKSFITPSVENHLKAAFDRALGAYNTDKEKGYKPLAADEILADAKKNNVGAKALVGEARTLSGREDDKIDELLDQAYKDAEGAIKNLASGKDEAMANLALQRKIYEYAKTFRRHALETDARRIAGSGIASSFVDYEWNCLRGVLSAAFHGRVVSGLRTYPYLLDRKGPQAFPTDATTQIPALEVGDARMPINALNPPNLEEPGCLLWTLMASRGLIWLVQEHWVFGTLYLLMALAICALFGGAVNRIAALHFAREEKISISQALKFSASKFLSFFMAPLIPIIIILGLGLLISLGGLLGNIPVVGPILVAALLGLALILGIAIAFLTVGLAGGLGLMYPTIAVEGSDSFDAISRSYSYIFARPWRAMLYGAVAMIYGAITYTFVRIFVYIALTATHTFVGLGIFGGGDRLGPAADRLDVIWTAPTFDSLFGHFSWAAMSGPDKTAAFIIGIWVFLVAVLVTAYLLSYAASATTIIYFLLRRKVDATDLDDVYVEEGGEDELAPIAAPTDMPAPAAAAVPAAPAAPAPVDQPPQGDAKP